MAEKKNQHYVPRFYIKNFSDDMKSIGCLNIPSSKIIRMAPIKSQCSKDYYYGSDLILENILGEIEKEVAPIIDKIIKDETLPGRGSSTLQTLLLFMALQYARTPAAATEYMHVINSVAKKVFHSIAIQNGLPTDQLPSLTTELPITHTISMAIDAYPLLQDLNVALLKNRTHMPYLTSDHPVVFYNQYLENERFSGPTGFFSPGLLIIMPISPVLSIIMYDDTIYTMFFTQNELIECHDVGDIIQLNKLQFISADGNMYFSSGRISDKELLYLLNCSCGYRTPHKSLTESLGVVGTSGQFIHTHSAFPSIGLNLTILTVKKEVKKRLARGFRVRSSRSPQIAELFREFQDQKESGVKTFNDFLNNRIRLM